MVSTRTRSGVKQREKPALGDITNDGKGVAKRRSAASQIAETGPQTVAKEEVPVAARTRSTRKKDSAVALIKPNRKLINENFLEQVQREERKKLFHRLTSGGAQPFLSLKEIGKIKLILPPFQNKKR